MKRVLTFLSCLFFCFCAASIEVPHTTKDNTTLSPLGDKYNDDVYSAYAAYIASEKNGVPAEDAEGNFSQAVKKELETNKLYKIQYTGIYTSLAGIEKALEAKTPDAVSIAVSRYLLEKNNVLIYTQNKLLFVTLGVTILVILTVFFIISYYYRIGVHKEYEKSTAAILAALEKERQRISRELHDSVAQEIRGVSFSQDQLWDEAKQGNLDEQLYRRINSVQSNTLKEIRTICFNLNPPDFDVADMNAALSELCTEFEKSNNIACNYIIKDMHIFDRIDSSQKLNLFRIIQEALNNTSKHAGAKQVSVTITSNASKQLIVFITDDGCGFDMNVLKKNRQNPQYTHFGINGMIQRISLMHGTIEFITAPGEGTEIKIEL